MDLTFFVGRLSVLLSPRLEVISAVAIFFETSKGCSDVLLVRVNERTRIKVFALNQVNYELLRDLKLILREHEIIFLHLQNVSNDGVSVRNENVSD